MNKTRLLLIFIIGILSILYFLKGNLQKKLDTTATASEKEETFRKKRQATGNLKKLSLAKKNPLAASEGIEQLKPQTDQRHQTEITEENSNLKIPSPKHYSPPLFPISADGIREAMGYARYDIKECYEEWLKLDKPIRGEITTQFTVSKSKHSESFVQDFKILQSTLQHTLLEGCIGNIIGELQFEPSKNAMTVTYPFSFETSQPNP